MPLSIFTGEYMKAPGSWNALEGMELVKKQTPEFHHDEQGNAHIHWPLHVLREKEKKGKLDTFDPETTPSIYIFSIHGQHLLVDKNGFLARDQKMWFPTAEEAALAKDKMLEEKISEVSNKKKRLESALKDQAKE